jgi:hypothetical protein
MKFTSADPEFPPMQQGEINELLNQPIYLRMAMIDDRAGTPLARAKVIDDPEYAKKITSRNLVRYMGSAESPEAKDRIELAKNYSAIEVTPYFIASWKA